jgi:hypothetical protein
VNTRSDLGGEGWRRYRRKRRRGYTYRRRDGRTGRGTGRSSRSARHPAGRSGGRRRIQHGGDDALEDVALIGVELAAEVWNCNWSAWRVVLKGLISWSKRILDADGEALRNELGSPRQILRPGGQHRGGRSVLVCFVRLIDCCRAISLILSSDSVTPSLSSSNSSRWSLSPVSCSGWYCKGEKHKRYGLPTITLPSLSGQSGFRSGSP